ncbi:MAG: hypothetical protein VKK04_04510 [Synechococcales bacterium]|nr:hypothetical protein [Synechococcales bacterium]
MVGLIRIRLMPLIRNLPSSDRPSPQKLRQRCLAQLIRGDRPYTLKRSPHL